MKRITLSILTSMLFVFLLIGCSSNDDTASTDTSDEVSETTDEKVNEEESDNDPETDTESTSDVKEENIRATNEGDGFTIVSGTYLKVPDEFPDDVPFPDNININSTTLGEEGSEVGYVKGILFTVEAPEDLDTLSKLYIDHFNNGDYTDVVEHDSNEIEDGNGYFQIKAKQDGENYEFAAQKRADDDVVTGEFSIRKN